MTHHPTRLVRAMVLAFIDGVVDMSCDAEVLCCLCGGSRQTALLVSSSIRLVLPLRRKAVEAL